MKSKRETLLLARQLIRSCRSSGKLEMNHLREAVERLVQQHPRGTVQILKALQRLIRLELEKYQARIQTAVPLKPTEKKILIQQLKTRFASSGVDVVADFEIDPSLLGGMKIQVGSDIWDGSVYKRLELLRNA